LVTIWREDANGVWKVALDLGVNHPRPEEAETEIRTYVPDSPLLDPASGRADLEKHSAVSQNHSRKMKPTRSSITPAATFAFIGVANFLPLERQLPKKSLLNRTQKQLRHQDADTRNPIDLVYEYGAYASERNIATQSGIYLYIWRLESLGQWRLALDLQKSAPKKKP
jgi:hypothetical protein